MEHKNIPKVRFSGFSEEWVENELDNLAKFSKGKGYSKSDLIEKGNPIILYGNLYTNYQTVIKEVYTYAKLNDDVFLSKFSPHRSPLVMMSRTQYKNSSANHDWACTKC